MRTSSPFLKAVGAQVRAVRVASAVALLAALATACSDDPQSEPEAAACDAPERSSCPATTPSYAADVAPLIAERCARCHRPGAGANQPPFDTHAKVFRQAGTILTVLHLCQMPPRGAPLSADERALLIGWLACGAPEN